MNGSQCKRIAISLNEWQFLPYIWRHSRIGDVGLEIIPYGEPYEKAYFSAENKVVPPGMSSSDLRRRDLALHRKIMFHEFGLTLPHLSYNYLHE